MHIHATQLNPYAALDALRSAQKTAAKREAELVRNELMESASDLAGEAEINDNCVIQIESRRQPKKRNQQSEPNRAEPEEENGSDEAEGHLSDWA